MKVSELFFIFAIGFIAGVFLSVMASYPIAEKYERCSESLLLKKAEYNQCHLELEDLNKLYSTTKGLYDTCLKEYTSLEENYSKLEERYEDIYWTAKKYEEDINDIKRWLFENRVFEVSKCVEGGVLNLPCVMLDFEYEEDPYDHAKSIKEFLRDKKGDCEDFAIFAAAVVRGAMEKGLKVKVAKEGKELFRINEEYVYENAEEVVLEPKSVEVVCGPEEDSLHCIIKVNDVFIEPQGGVVRDGFKKTVVRIRESDIYYWGTWLSEMEKEFKKFLNR